MNTLFSRDYINSNMMGPNALLLAEEVCRSLQLQPGMRVLDLACGTGMTSIYLAKAFNLEVTAMDLWIAAEDNQARFKAAGLEDRITAVNFDVTQMRPGHAPFAENSFDAVLSIDAYHYFGASSAFFDTHLAPFIKPGGQVAIVVPGLKKPFPLQQSVAPELAPWWQPGMNFFTVDWWMQLWQQSAFFTVGAVRREQAVHPGMAGVVGMRQPLCRTGSRDDGRRKRPVVQLYQNDRPHTQVSFQKSKERYEYQ
ncbi:hypothetical protein TUM4442_03520 [Shewanella algae]|uniref:SAM-dependent methyltransferase n=1 Tax=Shewanella algae TaxID=38313 RepID=UPI001BEF83C8|nr:methyltransferase domain-containing protein [Shewanella algae]BCV30825.1 hypothetical protein TUM4442_03520 [Shewanella algae]